MKKQIINSFDIFERKVFKGNKLIVLPIIMVAILLLIDILGTKTEPTTVLNSAKAHYTPIEKIESLEVKKEKTIERAFMFLIQYEGYHDTPYWDYKQWSCGYGMSCTKDTKNITKEKSKKYVIDRLSAIYDGYNLDNLQDEGMIVALLSFTYNIGSMPSGYRWYIEHNHINALKNRMKKYVYA